MKTKSQIFKIIFRVTH